MHQSLRSFVTGCESTTAETEGTADRVTAIAPLMRQLAANAGDFLSADHVRSEPEHYARDAIYITPGGNLSLHARMPDLAHHESR